MLVSDTFRRFIHFDKAEWPPVMEAVLKKGTTQFQPVSLGIDWQTDRVTGEWALHRVTVYGFNHPARDAAWTEWVSVFEAGQVLHEIPEWLPQHIVAAYPGFSALVASAVRETMEAVLGITSPSN